MKILISDPGDDNLRFMRLGIISAIKHYGFTCQLLDKQVKPVFDAFNEMKPDLYLGTDASLSKAEQKCLEKYPTVKYYPIDRLPFAFDDLNFRRGKTDVGLQCDLARVGPPVKNLFNYLSADINCKFFGNTSYSVPEYMGRVEPEDYPDIFYNAKMTIVVDMEQFYQVAGCGGVPLYIGDMGKDPVYTNCKWMDNGEFPGMIRLILSPNFEREEYKRILHDYIVPYNTYHCRLAEIFEALDFHKEAAHITSTL